MGFSREWDERYRENEQMSVWPFSDLISYVKRYGPPCRKGMSVLELGCGAGANIPFFRRLGAEYYAVEGSEFIVGRLRRSFPGLSKRIVAGYFTEELPFRARFDLVVDRSALTHSTTAGIRRALSFVHARLKPGGRFIGIDWFSTLHSDRAKGRAQDDAHTRSAFEGGQFAGVGRVHFSDRPHLLRLFSGFALRVLEHKVVRRELPRDGHVFASWNLVAVKEGR